MMHGPIYIRWENTVQRGNPHMIVWLMSIEWWIRKVKNIHSQYVTLTVFPLQQWLHGRGSLLRHTYITLPVLLRISITSDRQLTMNISIVNVFMNIFFRTGLACQVRGFSTVMSQNINTRFLIPADVRPIRISLTVCSTQ